MRYISEKIDDYLNWAETFPFHVRCILIGIPLLFSSSLLLFIISFMAACLILSSNSHAFFIIPAYIAWVFYKAIFTNGYERRGKAFKYPNGTIMWFLNNRRHREDGPAVECPDGTKEWFLNNRRHREDGPAVECADGHKEWFLNDIEYTEEEFKKKGE